ncbi:MAG: phosphatase PAP2 family protein [Dehalococcoidia bacterium]
MAAVRSKVWGKLTARDGAAAHLREVLLLVGAYFTYMLVRKIIVPGADSIGFENAVRVISFEKDLGFFWELDLQAWALEGGKAVALVFNYLYIGTLFPIILTTGVLFYFRNRKRYFYYRGLILLSFAVALVVFASFPLAPPRMITTEGIADTVALYGPPWYASREAAAFYNAFAAMPSLHFAWTVLFGFLFWNTGPKFLKLVGILYPTVTFLAITITGNHYIIDAIAGALMMLFVFLLYEGIFRGRYRQALAYVRATVANGRSERAQ